MMDAMDMPDISTTGRRREVGAELKRIRCRRNWPAYKLAEKLGWTPSHISRSEAGKRRVTDVDAGHYLGMCGANDQELQDLLKLVNEPDDYRLRLHQGQIPDQVSTLTFLESTAAQINGFEPIYIPCVAQTPDYARALLHEELGLDDPSLIDPLVELRMSRSEILARTKPPQCVYLVHESVLRMPIGGTHVMRRQLRHLLSLGERPECLIRVVPISAGARGLSRGAIQIFDFKEDPSVICLQHETASEFLETDVEVSRCRNILERIASVCLNGQQSKALLAKMVTDLDRYGYSQYSA